MYICSIFSILYSASKMQILLLSSIYNLCLKCANLYNVRVIFSSSISKPSVCSLSITRNGKYTLCESMMERQWTHLSTPPPPSPVLSAATHISISLPLSPCSSSQASWTPRADPSQPPSLSSPTRGERPHWWKSEPPGSAPCWSAPPYATVSH